MAGGEYTNDPTIPNDAELWRRIPPHHIFYDENEGRWRPSTAAFENHPNGSPMSVLLGEMVLRSGRGPLDILTGYEGYALASIAAGLARQCNQGVAREPLPDEPAHAVVFGEKTYSVKKRFACGCGWAVGPTNR